MEPLTQELGRAPRIAEIAARTGLSEEGVLEAMELADSRNLLSLDRVLPSGRTVDPAVDDPGLDRVDEKELVSRLLAHLSERERVVLRMRFGEELTQSRIAARLGVSQMMVSRLLARTLSRMRILAQAS